jgi:hypothetical protein
MPELKIERLVLKAGGMDARAARRLAEAVAAGMERAPIAADLGQRAELVRLQVRAAPGATTDSLTQQILGELVRELERS